MSKSAPAIYEDFDENDIDAQLKKELNDKNLEYRFVDFKKAKELGGRSRGGWILYKRESQDPRIQGISSLIDPDGLVRQGTLVLAVKTKAMAERKRDNIASQSRTLKQYNEDKARELSGDARKLGSSRVLSGYEKNS